MYKSYSDKVKIRWSTLFAIVALVFAMTGGAYAAGKYIITSTKQISPKVLKAIAGKMGAPGPAGPSGSAGATGVPGEKGANGEKGEKGERGTAGESVTGKTVPTKEPKCNELGGAEYTVAGKTTVVCNGETGFTDTLPIGKTETGTWAFVTTAAGSIRVPLSFSIPLAAALEESNLHFVKAGGTGGAECPGSVAEPEAASGNVCVYAQFEQVPFEEFVIPRTAGVSLFFNATGAGMTDEGTWAVTG